MKKNPHRRERWWVFTAIFAVAWFAYFPKLRPNLIEMAQQAVGLAIGSALVYALIGRVIVWFWVNIQEGINSAKKPQRQSASDREQMRQIVFGEMARKPDSLVRPIHTPQEIYLEPFPEEQAVERSIN